MVDGDFEFCSTPPLDGTPDETPFEAGARLAMAGWMLSDWAEFDRAVFEEIIILVRGADMCFFVKKSKKSS